MLTQWCLPPPLTSTVKSSLFTHVHSSPLSLAARLHQCHANHSRYVNNGWTISEQTSQVLSVKREYTFTGRGTRQVLGTFVTRLSVLQKEDCRQVLSQGTSVKHPPLSQPASRASAHTDWQRCQRRQVSGSASSLHFPGDTFIKGIKALEALGEREDLRCCHSRWHTRGKVGGLLTPRGPEVPSQVILEMYTF
ncbi:hypothetical protein HJG60_011798 [Phyllostomus discolor]|uniref:Uncharacterized protein n=1 Tax=Phyllostomus discolor TaxID=89673 RepID=A0A833ZKQ4_9CHIR|nr:hypothetical protein HJG60_011798 [Phyllostomus discolor]